MPEYARGMGVPGLQMLVTLTASRSSLAVWPNRSGPLWGGGYLGGSVRGAGEW